MGKSIKRVLFKGDEVPKLNIICDVLPETLRKEFRDAHNKAKKDVRLIHCDTIAHIEYNDIVDVYSMFVPYGVIIYMYFTKKEVDEVSNYRNNKNSLDEIVYMEPYPFTLGEKIRTELDEINQYIINNLKIQYKFMFYRNINQKSGVGDLIGIDQALKDAPELIKKSIQDDSILNAIEYSVYKSPKDLIDIVHGGLGKLSIVMVVCTERFRRYQERISAEEFFSEYGDYKNILEFENYDKYSKLLRTESINKVTKFQKVKGSKNILKTYVENYVNEFQDTLLDLIKEVYIEVVKDICFWDLEKDIANLKEGSKKLIYEYLMSTSIAKEKCPQYESDYNEKIRNNLKLDTLFEEKAISLVNDEMMVYLHTYLKRKEEMLSKTFLYRFDNWD